MKAHATTVRIDRADCTGIVMDLNIKVVIDPYNSSAEIDLELLKDVLGNMDAIWIYTEPKTKDDIEKQKKEEQE